MPESRSARSRALRRHHRRRVFQKRWRQWRQTLWWAEIPPTMEELEPESLRRLRRFARTPVLCSCPLCRPKNPRRRYGDQLRCEDLAVLAQYEELLEEELELLMPPCRFSSYPPLGRQLARIRRWTRPGAEGERGPMRDR